MIIDLTTIKEFCQGIEMRKQIRGYTYAADFDGESTSTLHRGTPTDRLVLSWNITDPHVIRRLDKAEGASKAEGRRQKAEIERTGPKAEPPGLAARASEVGDAPVINQT